MPRLTQARTTVAAARRVLHEQGVEKTTLADIAKAADVPVGNVYYYFKTKDELVGATIGAHAQELAEATAALDRLPTPQERLKMLIRSWVDQRDLAARYGCPFGTLTSELDKRDDGLDREAGKVMKLLLDWAENQFRQMGLDDAHDTAVEFVAAYQGMSVLTNALRDPEIMTVQGRRLQRWIDTMATTNTAEGPDPEHIPETRP